VRRQVCKRIDRRIRDLGLTGVEAYRALLLTEPSEWDALDELTRITISRFFRERDAFTYLDEIVLPELGAMALPGAVRIWSAGCGGGEEPYTLAIAAKRRGIAVRIVATDADPDQLRRAGEARYAPGSLKELPAEWKRSAFAQEGDKLVLREELRRDVELVRQDIRKEMPPGPFHLVLCRYLAFTYFEPRLEETIAARLLARTIPGGYIALGKHESWPEQVPGLTEAQPRLRIYRRDPQHPAQTA
jgi:chemotaxis protein methyltransferase CheR